MRSRKAQRNEHPSVLVSIVSMLESSITAIHRERDRVGRIAELPIHVVSCSSKHIASLIRHPLSHDTNTIPTQPSKTDRRITLESIYRRPNLLLERRGVSTTIQPTGKQCLYKRKRETVQVAQIEDLLLLLLRRLQDLKRAEQTLIHTHHRPRIVELAAVVRCREESDELALGEELVPIFDNLMCATDEVHVVLLEEAGDNVRAEGEANTTVVLGPSGDVLVGVGPQEIAEETAVGNLEN